MNITLGYSCLTLKNALAYDRTVKLLIMPSFIVEAADFYLLYLTFNKKLKNIILIKKKMRIKKCPTTEAVSNYGAMTFGQKPFAQQNDQDDKSLLCGSNVCRANCF